MSRRDLFPRDPVPPATLRSARAVSLVAGLIVIAAPVLGWLGRSDPARTFFGILIGTVVGLAIGLLGPGVATSLTGLIGPVVRPVLGVVTLALLAWAVLGALLGSDAPTKTISLFAASLMVAAWIPLSRLSGR